MTLLEEIIDIDTPTLISELLEKNNNSFEKALLIGVRDIYSEKMEDPLIALGLQVPEGSSHQELTVITPHTFSPTPDDLLLLRSTPYSLEIGMLEESTVHLNSSQSHGYILDHKKNKKYVLEGKRSEGFVSATTSKRELYNVLDDLNGLAEEDIIKSEIFGIDEVPTSVSRQYLQDKLNVAHNTHTQLQGLFPQSDGYEKVHTLRTTTRRLGRKSRTVDILSKFNLQLRDGFQFIEGTEEELKNNPTYNQQLMKEIGVFALSSSLTLVPNQFSLYALPLALYTGADLIMRAANRVADGPGVGLYGTLIELKRSIENTDDI